MNAPIGIDDFKMLVESNLTFIDKTLLIDELLSSGTHVTLFTRPRRFGKSLNLSMIKYFLDIKEDSTNLFSNLKVAKTNTYSKLNTHPVIHLSFKNAKGDFNRIVSFIYESLKNIFKMTNEPSYQLEIDEYLLEFNKKSDFDLITSSKSLYFLSEVLYKKYNKKVFILIDEYDSPFINAIESNCYDEIKGFVSSLYGTSLKGNEYLEKGILTGIQRVAKENIFSDLNNLVVNTVLTKKMNEYFGFTTKETEYYLNLFNLELNDEVKNMYNGYKFGNVAIYNPWSVINYAENNELIAYWANTGKNTLLKENLLNSSDSFKEDFNTLILNNEVEVSVDIDLSVLETTIQSKYLWGLFLNSGYITIKKDLGKKNFLITVPNDEVKDELNDLFLSLLKLNDVPNIFNYLINKEYDKFIDKYKDFIMNNTSFHDHSKKNEYSYHMFTLGMLSMRLNYIDYNITSNLEKGNGRPDILCESKGSKPHLIFEFKVSNNLDLAINQVKNKKYSSNLKGEIILIGITYDKKECYIKIEEI